MRRELVALVVTVLAATPASGQQFFPGEIYHVSPALPDTPSNLGGVARVLGGGASWEPFYVSDVQFSGFGAAYCPFRQAIAVSSNTVVHLIDASPSRVTLGPYPRGVSALAARGDGLIYGVPLSNPPSVEVIGADDSFQALDDGTGSAFVLPVINCRAAWYDASTGSLFTAHSGADTTIVKTPLSADGMSVDGPVTMTTFDASTQGGEVPVQFSQGPGPLLMVKTIDGSILEGRRMFTVDPATLETAVFATSGFGIDVGGVYVPEAGSVLGVDTFRDRYRRHNGSTTGDGIDLGPAPSSPFSTGDPITLLRIPESAVCPPDVNTTNTNPGDPGYGSPDGTVDGADLSYFVENWLAQNAAVADVNTTNVNPGDAGYGQPDGVVDGADLSYFVENWLAGCP